MTDHCTGSGLRPLHASGFSVADSVIIGLTCVGYYLGENARILDFGCGAGSLVYEFRDRGLAAYGFDIHNYLSLRDPADKKWFGIASGISADSSDMSVDWANCRIPFPDNSFDLIFSTTVLEHILDLGPAAAEMARVLRPDGIALHLFPSRGNLIEPHMFVPLATRIKWWWWFYIWAALGFRNEHQVGKSANRVADAYFTYSNTGLSYRSDAEIISICGNYFRSAYFVDRLYYATAWWRDDLRNYRAALWSRHWVRHLAAVPKLRALLLLGKK